MKAHKPTPQSLVLDLYKAATEDEKNFRSINAVKEELNSAKDEVVRLEKKLSDMQNEKEMWRGYETKTEKVLRRLVDTVREDVRKELADAK